MEGDAGLEAGIPTRLTPAEGRRFGLTVGVAFLVLAGLLHFWRHKETAAVVAGGLGVLLVAAGLVIPGRLGPLHRAWMGHHFGHRMVSYLAQPYAWCCG